MAIAVYGFSRNDRSRDQQQTLKVGFIQEARREWADRYQQQGRTAGGPHPGETPANRRNLAGRALRHQGFDAEVADAAQHI